MTVVLYLKSPGRAIARNEVDTVLLKVVIESVAVIGAIVDEMLMFSLQPVEVETELHQMTS